MPFVLIIAGVVLIISAVRNSQQQLFYLLALDFTGPNNFIFWFISILIIGALGYIPKAKPLSDGFLILVILVLFLKKGRGFFDMFQKQIGGTVTTAPKVSASGTGQGSASFVGVGTTGATPGGISISVGGTGGNVNSGGGNISIGGVGGGSRDVPFGCDPFWDPWCFGGGNNGGGGYGGGSAGMIPGFFPN